MFGSTIGRGKVDFKSVKFIFHMFGYSFLELIGFKIDSNLMLEFDVFASTIDL
jgi:hypothetical protein